VSENFIICSTDIRIFVSKYWNMLPANLFPLTGSFLGCWCNVPWVFKCPLFLVFIKQKKGCKHNGIFSQCVMKNGCKDEMQLLFTIIAKFVIFFFFLDF